MSRLIIYTEDVQELTGLSSASAKARLSSCRKHYGIPNSVLNRIIYGLSADKLQASDSVYLGRAN